MGAFEEEGYKGYSTVNLQNKEQIAQIRGERNELASGLFEDAASCFIVVTHTGMEKLTSLPFPMGTLMEAIEEVVVPIAHPIEGFTLHFLAAIDDQIYAVGTSVERSIVFTSEKVNLVLTLLRKRGLLGMSADFWVRHEASMRERLQRMIDMVKKVPLIGVATPFVCTISAPLVNALSNWLVEHSQSQDKTIQPNYEEGKRGKREFISEMEEESEDKQGIVEGKDMKAGEEIEAKKDAVWSTVGKVEMGVQEEKSALRKDKEISDGDKNNDANDVSAVLEMIDSGWLLGSGGAVLPRKLVVAPPPPSMKAPKKQANSKSKRGSRC